MTDRDTMDRTLDIMTADEIADALHFVEVLERGQHMDRTEADEWRRRIVARQA